MTRRRYILDLGHGVRRVYYQTGRGVLAVTQRRVRVGGRVLWAYQSLAVLTEVPS